MQVILASASPRRRELLEQIGLRFQVVSSEVNEASLQETLQGLSIGDQASTLAEAKALEVAKRHPHALVIGADTLVTLDGTPLGKPKNAEHAANMLRRLSGRTHTVWTGVAVAANGGEELLSFAEETQVRFRVLTSREIEAYVATGESFDKAGAYGIQGRAAIFVESIQGCYFNVVGLPLAKISSALIDLGCDMIAAWESES